MRTLIKLPIFLALIMLIFCCLLSSAHANESVMDLETYRKEEKANRAFMTFDKPSWTREEYVVKRVIDRAKDTNSSISIQSSRQNIQTANNREYIFKDQDSVTRRVNNVIDEADSYVVMPEKEKHAIIHQRN